MDEIRIDRWLWAARLFKARSAASEACQAGKVKLNGRSVKPSRAVKIGDEVQITRKMIKQRVIIAGIRERRVSPKIAAELYEDITPQEEIEQARLIQTMESTFYKDQRRTGRPTKRDRRAFQKLKGKF
jgi:ribosome-associated heat shock protein Hsp15